MSVLLGKNAVLEALKSQMQINKVSFSKSINRKDVAEIIALCEEKKIPYTWVEKEKLDQLGKAHQGVAGFASPIDYVSLDSLLQHEGLLVILDGITDPHNLGAILRSAHAFGAVGIVLPKRRSATLDEVSFKASAGAAAHLPIARVSNLRDAVDACKERGFWVYGADLQGKNFLPQVAFDKKAVIIIGSEDKGIGDLLKKNCDVLYKIPMGDFDSLNASVAAGISFYQYFIQHR